MMQDLAMHCLDIAYNSIRAKARNIDIIFETNDETNTISMSIQDDGCGMNKTQLAHVADPFYTTRTTRKIGLGVAFLKGLAQQCDGTFLIESETGKGTLTSITLKKDHWDTPPIGDLAECLSTLIQADQAIDIHFTYRTDQKEFNFTTEEIRTMMEDVPLNEPSIVMWIKDYVTEQIALVSK